MGKLNLQQQRRLDILVAELDLKLATLKEHSTGELSGLIVLLAEMILLLERKTN